jgi:CRISPR-associated protein Csm4
LKFYEITITPTSPFGTPLKGDTLFGHFCWQAAYDPDLLEGGLESQLQRYREKPFAVFSSAFPKIEGPRLRYLMPRPEAVVLDRGMETGETRRARLLGGKELKTKIWMVLENIDVIDPAAVQFLTGKEAAVRIAEDRAGADNAGDVVSAVAQPHNTINRITGTTGSGMFAPHATEIRYYLPGITLAVCVLLDEACTDIQRVCKGMERIGQWGFGRDASTGLGRFAVTGHKEHLLPRLDQANACYSLAPTVPQKDAFAHTFFTPFVRFGKHGDRLATGSVPFKRPVVMADEGAVFIPTDADSFTTPWLGTGISGVSYAEVAAVAQGYSPWLPIKMEV